jgi:hypothetical protein
MVTSIIAGFSVVEPPFVVDFLVIVSFFVNHSSVFA